MKRHVSVIWDEFYENLKSLLFLERGILNLKTRHFLSFKFIILRPIKNSAKSICFFFFLSNQIFY